MIIRHDLSQLPWRLTGSQPWQWLDRLLNPPATHLFPVESELPEIPARVPGSVQMALLDAGLLPDWNVGLNAQQCEWVENRHWVYETELPGEWFVGNRSFRLVCEGLDYSGWVYLNQRKIGEFKSTFIPHAFDLDPDPHEELQTLRIVFDLPPRWLGQYHPFSSQIEDSKPRFNYTWDWTSRLDQIGIWDAIRLESRSTAAFAETVCIAKADSADGTSGHIEVRGVFSEPPSHPMDCRVTVRLVDPGGHAVIQEMISPEQFVGGWKSGTVGVEPWQPNGSGKQILYSLRVELSGPDGVPFDVVERKVGFRHIAWHACEGAPEAADPWICIVNDRPVFLQGVNWTPIRPNFADVTDDDYIKRIQLYREMGCNVLRVWGGAILEREVFYDLCDEAGLLVWQEFSLSSAALDAAAPTAPSIIHTWSELARSYIRRRRHHPSLFMWCGGNEFVLPDIARGSESVFEETKANLMDYLAAVVAEEDPGRRFLRTSPSGPRFLAIMPDFGKGEHWDVHGPWIISREPEFDFEAYWANDDALFRSEAGAPSASPVDLLERFRGPFDLWPPTAQNPYWRRSPFWIEWPDFVREYENAETATIDEFVTWSQARQARALSLAASSCKNRFPRCGGFIVWMGHDCFPCTANTSIVDFDGRPKPAAIALQKVFTDKQTI